MRTHSNRTSPAPLYPPASWSNVEARFDHFEDLVRESGRSVPFILSGRMTCDPKGRPMRRIPTPSATRHEGLIQSIKNHRTMHWEAEAERPLILHSEVDAEFLSYSCQPHRLDLYVMSPQERCIRCQLAHIARGIHYREHLVAVSCCLKRRETRRIRWSIPAINVHHGAAR